MDATVFLPTLCLLYFFSCAVRMHISGAAITCERQKLYIYIYIYIFFSVKDPDIFNDQRCVKLWTLIRVLFRKLKYKIWRPQGLFWSVYFDWRFSEMWHVKSVGDTSRCAQINKCIQSIVQAVTTKPVTRRTSGTDTNTPQSTILYMSILTNITCCSFRGMRIYYLLPTTYSVWYTVCFDEMVIF